MIIQCGSCSRKFIVRDVDIPSGGRDVQCGYCSVFWHQMPVSVDTKTVKTKKVNQTFEEVKKSTPSKVIKASDGKTYKFLGFQWAEVLPSGKTTLHPDGTELAESVNLSSPLAWLSIFSWTM